MNALFATPTYINHLLRVLVSKYILFPQNFENSTLQKYDKTYKKYDKSIGANKTRVSSDIFPLKTCMENRITRTCSVLIH